MSSSLTDPVADAISLPSQPTFAELNLSAPLLEAVESSGYTTATPIQASAIPLLLAGRDVLGQAQTGTGKTAAFALPLLQQLDPAQRVPQVLVLTPTRELAIQVAEAFERYASGLAGVRVVPIYGGQDYQVQFRALDRGVQVVVGTPGRVMDHIRRGSLDLSALRGLVLDEADEMLKMGFAEDVEWILTQAPIQRQIALFSATLPSAIRRIAQQYLRDPAQVTIRQKAATADTVRQRFVIAPSHHKDEALCRILEAEPIDGVLVFVRTKGITEPLAEYLASQGHRTAALSSDVSQKQRERVVDGLRAGKVDVIVATDVAARGLDVQRISHVINYDLPFDNESYVHRIGRTGRAGRTGDAILFLKPRERHLLRRIEQATRQTIEPMDVPTKRVINQRRTAKFHERITAALAHPDIATFTSLVDQYRQQHDLPVEQIAAALAAMAAGDAPILLRDDLKPASFANEGRSDDHRRGSANDRRGHDRGRDGQTNRQDGPRRSRRQQDTVTMETFRIEIGAEHQVRPGNIVGALANETGLQSSQIGRIEIYDKYSTVDLLAGMPEEMFQALKHIWVLGRQLRITRAGEPPEVYEPKSKAKDSKGKPKKKKQRKVAVANA